MLSSAPVVMVDHQSAFGIWLRVLSVLRSQPTLQDNIIAFNDVTISIILLLMELQNANNNIGFRLCLLFITSRLGFWTFELKQIVVCFVFIWPQLLKWNSSNLYASHEVFGWFVQSRRYWRTVRYLFVVYYLCVVWLIILVLWGMFCQNGKN